MQLCSRIRSYFHPASSASQGQSSSHHVGVPRCMATLAGFLNVIATPILLGTASVAAHTSLTQHDVRQGAISLLSGAQGVLCFLYGTSELYVSKQMLALMKKTSDSESLILMRPSSKKVVRKTPMCSHVLAVGFRVGALSLPLLGLCLSVKEHSVQAFSCAVGVGAAGADLLSQSLFRLFSNRIQSALLFNGDTLRSHLTALTHAVHVVV